jgi:hypothetical protein
MPEKDIEAASFTKVDRSAFSIVHSFEEADQLDRAYSWSKTPEQRMQALEFNRQVAFGYGNGKPFPRFSRVLEIVKSR